MYKYPKNPGYICTLVDTSINLNGYPYLAEVLEFLNAPSMYTPISTQRYEFVFRRKNNFPLNDRSNYDYRLFVRLTIQRYDHDENGNHYLDDLYVLRRFKEVRIKNFNKVGVMTLEDSEFDKKNCTIKRKGSNCKMESIVEFETIPPELINSGCVKISYNIYDYFYTCDYTITTSTTTTTKTSTTTKTTTKTLTTALTKEKSTFKQSNNVFKVSKTPTFIIVQTSHSSINDNQNIQISNDYLKIENKSSKFLSWLIVTLVIVFALVVPGIGYYIKRKEFDPSLRRSKSSDISSLETELTIK
jgi:hypothetical protein